MSIIAGLAKNGNVYMASDSAATAGTLTIEERYPKIGCIADQEGEPYLIGCIDSIRLNQIVQAHLVITEYDPDPMMHMIKNFVEPLRSVLKDFGFSTKDQHAGREHGGFLLVGYMGRLYSVQADYQVSESISGYDAVGCASPMAIGSLHTTERLAHYPDHEWHLGKSRVVAAVEASIHHDIYCGGKITYGVMKYVHDSNSRIVSITYGDGTVVQLPSRNRG